MTTALLKIAISLLLGVIVVPFVSAAFPITESLRTRTTWWERVMHCFGKHKTRTIARYYTGNLLICDICAGTFVTFGNRLIKCEPTFLQGDRK
jgi:hypothetical protein